MPTCYFPMRVIGIKQVARPEKEINLFSGFRLDYSECAHRGIASHYRRKRKINFRGPKKAAGALRLRRPRAGRSPAPRPSRQACGRPFFQAAEPGRRLRRCILMFLNSSPLRPRWRSYALWRLCSEIMELTQKTAMTTEHFFEGFLFHRKDVLHVVRPFLNFPNLCERALFQCPSFGLKGKRGVFVGCP